MKLDITYNKVTDTNLKIVSKIRILFKIRKVEYINVYNKFK